MDEAGPRSSPQSPNEADFTKFILAADELIERSPLGGYGAFVAPFSKQFKDHLRDLFPFDKEAFDETDANEREAIRKAVHMRLVTLALFAAWSAVVVIASTSYFGQAKKDGFGGWLFLGGFALFTLAVVGLRRLIRDHYLHDILKDATTFALYFLSSLSNLHDRANNAIRDSHQDRQLSQAWAERSAAWVKIALWHGRRYENLDRYVTATAWRIESRWRIYERFFGALKATLAVGVVLASLGLAFILKIGEPPIAPTAIALLIYVLTVVPFWGLLPQTNNALWAETFRVGVVGFDAQKAHIHNLIAGVVRADKNFILGNQRTVGKEGGAKT